jgi:hypothetical protein
LLARRCVAWAAPYDSQRVVESRGDFGRWQVRDPRRGELDCQRLPVEPTANRCDGRTRDVVKHES